jgi:glycolate oxidase iron-sulfur subunit
VTEPEQSLALLESKMEKLGAAQPDVVVTANPGCQLQLKSGAAEHLPKVEVMHVAELLERAYRAASA